MKNVGRVLDSSLLFDEKIELILQNVFGAVPLAAQEALCAVMNFYLCGEQTTPNEPAPPEQLLHWEKDSMRIWADFRIYVGIDLDTAQLHWWEFRALFASLPPESQIKRAIGLRALDLSQIEDARQRREYERQKRAVALDVIDYERQLDALWERSD